MRMKLAAKGRHAPPPRLAAPFQAVSETVQSWPGIVAATHWHYSRNGRVDGADFYRGEEELGHIHLDGELHLVTTPAIARALVAAGVARPFPWAQTGDWITTGIRTEADARRAERLMRLAYDLAGGVPETDLLASLPQVLADDSRAADRENATAMYAGS